ncbi:MAG TPA: MBOAT family protein [Planctomycetota bacterium]|nr:MBOAT family protein [Planctomycetota bacterium]
MVFTSSLFLFYFLPAFLVLYHLAPRVAKNAVALFASLAFYAWGAPEFVYVLLGGTLVDYLLSHAVVRSPHGRRRKLWVWLSVVGNIGVLSYFKYANFFVAQLDSALASMGHRELTWTAVALPIGISFFTFQKLSYVIDVYRGTAQPARSFADCLLYVVLFPQLIAGPIVRYHDVDLQIRSRQHTADRFWRGVERFVLGLCKKALLANGMAAVCDPVFNRPIGVVSQGFAWMAAFAYYFQIYFDFSGYSDMAIGLGRMMGFEFLENFDRPYVARTFTEFWRRWHISLSNFMREYIYIPLGGNRVGTLRGYLNLWVVFLISGFWHGAAWNFVVWGAYQGVFLTVDKLGWQRIAARLPALVLRPMMVFLVLVSWVIFNTRDLTHAGSFLARMFRGSGPDWTEPSLNSLVPLDTYTLVLFAVAALVAFLPWSQRYLALEQRFLAWARTRLGAPVFAVVVWLGLVIGCLAVVNSSYNPFIYFRF